MPTKNGPARTGAKGKRGASSSENANTLRLNAAPDTAPETLVAQTMLRPSVQAASTLRLWKPVSSDVDLAALMAELCVQSKLASSGNLERAEAMLINEAHTLDAIFNNLARRAAANAGEYINACEIYLRLALKAQSQCRATLETLAAMKNPVPVAFVRQANIAHGPQQVNNAVGSPEASRARESENPPNELLEQKHGERLDTGAARAAATGDSRLEAVGAVQGTPLSGR